MENTAGRNSNRPHREKRSREDLDQDGEGINSNYRGQKANANRGEVGKFKTPSLEPGECSANIRGRRIILGCGERFTALLRSQTEGTVKYGTKVRH